VKPVAFDAAKDYPGVICIRDVRLSRNVDVAFASGAIYPIAHEIRASNGMRGNEKDVVDQQPLGRLRDSSGSIDNKALRSVAWLSNPARQQLEVSRSCADTKEGENLRVRDFRGSYKLFAFDQDSGRCRRPGLHWNLREEKGDGSNRGSWSSYAAPRFWFRTLGSGPPLTVFAHVRYQILLGTGPIECLRTHLSRGKSWCFYNGMLPCFLRGLASTLFSSSRSAPITRGRVSRGSMTSST
jgi:hypothetical protein